jgi:hypothetical protein
MRGIPWLAENRLASQEKLCCMGKQKRRRGNAFVIFTWKRLEKYPLEGQTFQYSRPYSGIPSRSIKRYPRWPRRLKHAPLWLDSPCGPRSPCYWDFWSRSDSPHSAGLRRTSDRPFAETSTDNTHHLQETDVHDPFEIEPAIPAIERPQTFALDRTAPGLARSMSVTGATAPIGPGSRYYRGF